jgi:hypothetical protein
MKKNVDFVTISTRILLPSLISNREGSCMARGRKTSLTIRLTPAQRQTLLVWQRATAIPARLARRGWIILLVADGVSISDVAAMVGVSRRFVYKWIQRFVQEGLEGLHDKSRYDRWIEPGQAALTDLGFAECRSAPLPRRPLLEATRDNANCGEHYISVVRRLKVIDK